MNIVQKSRLAKLLRERTSSLFATLDAARIGDLTNRLGTPEVHALFEGQDQTELRDVAPYLVAVDKSLTLEHLVEESWGRSWGIYLSCNEPVDKILAHLRQFVKVKTEDGGIMYFRFYDPRVLRVFLPTCTPEQAIEFFGPIQAFWVEGEDPSTCLLFRRGTRGVEKEAITLNS